MVLWLLFALPAPTFAGVEKIHGVAPSLLSRYVAPASDSAPWSCLDGSKTITWAAVNDDYCDCPDGSDEPGTGACPNSMFYCKNEGHIGSLIPSTRVNDGLCEPECCDGSDERLGVCPNVCHEVGAVYREQQTAERKMRSTGSKIRRLYIASAQKEKQKLESQITAAEAEIADLENDVARMKDLIDRTESLSAAALEHKKQSPLYVSFMEHTEALKSLQREYKKRLAREKALGDILDALRRGYNPNYQDMAVLEAVRGWEALARLPHINDVAKDDGEGEQQVITGDEEYEEEEWTAEELEKELDSLLNSDYEALLLEHEKHIGAPTPSSSLLLDLTAYIPDSLLPHYQAFTDTLMAWLEALGIAQGPASADSPDTSKARQAYTNAENSLNAKKQELQRTQEELTRMFDPEWFGSEGEWKRLQGVCLSKDTGDYTYEVCLFDEARQKPNKGGSIQSLGKFASWNAGGGAAVGSPEYYSKQHYTRGTKCWNGPMRSVTVILTCGLENELLSIAEPEKCEYQFKGTTPALCLPPDAQEDKHDEL
ncbi:hypothetical protein POSPLADRAFT_1148504 [Postia placenta MAD-698-R-SB12]|uniref:Glucosidase 2 subunit beta n=1 Tax=Postia placenta MAD-698-R-SB12 TaxID=670580 RepID=A0A1X6MW31_9APHY|nr:hypothetical protein POSPLADRAFT_1148504 [Postia placenta MAD-698-R-SB12]OSX60577.1 hypothetical protein POSPLADRAFT_1148504 [Postia placenta MAD-698-R-SB12]